MSLTEKMPEHMPAQSQDSMPADEHKMDPAPDYTPRYPGSGRLDGKVALITGGDSGIGRAVAALYAREGAKVAINYLEETKDAERTKEIVEEEGGECLLLPGDNADPDAARGFVEKTVEHFGQLDILVNNAAQQWMNEDLRDLTPEQLDRTMKSNVYGYFYMAQAALDHLGEGDVIINTTSVNAFAGMGALTSYSTTRGASLAFTRSLADQLVGKGIRVNAVAPGPIWTPFIPGTMPADQVEGFGKKTPMGRPGQPWEVASCFLFLACKDSNYITGQTLHPNGGMIVGA